MQQPILVDEAGNEYIAYEYSLVADFASITPGQSLIANPRIDNSAEFVWTKTSCSANIADAEQTSATRVLPNCTMQVSDGSSDRPLQSAPVSLLSNAGTAELPYILSIPLVIIPTANLTVVVRNISGATIYADLQIVFHGYRRVYGSDRR
jgi:hypothetical protein